MGDGCYDLDGKCVNCNKMHPCDCEMYKDKEEESLMSAVSNKNDDAVDRLENASKKGKIIRII